MDVVFRHCRHISEVFVGDPERDLGVSHPGGRLGFFVEAARAGATKS
jgi:hypothetical protein